MKIVSAADANRHFSQILRDLRGGETVVVTSRGKPVARIEAVCESEQKEAERQKAWEAHIARLRSQTPMNLGTFNRDELYDD